MQNANANAANIVPGAAAGPHPHPDPDPDPVPDPSPGSRGMQPAVSLANIVVVSIVDCAVSCLSCPVSCIYNRSSCCRCYCCTNCLLTTFTLHDESCSYLLYK